MGKVLKIIGTVITIAAIAIATAGAGIALIGLGTSVGTAIGAGAALVGSITGIGLGTLIAAGAIISSIGSAMAQPRALEETGANLRGNAYVDANAYGAFVFGTTALPQNVMYEAAFGTNDQEITAVLAHAWHEINDYRNMWVEGELAINTSGTVQGDFAGILTREENLGTTGQSALTLTGSGWPSTAKGRGIAHTGVEWDFGNEQTKFTQVPTRIVSEAQGALLYDPRLDSTQGGSGAHRYGTPSTWTWNNGNAALVALRYLIGEYSSGGDLVWGFGEAETEIDFASFITAANIADETRDGVPRYRLGGFFETTNSHENFFDLWESNTGGQLIRVGGKRYIWLPNDDLTPSGTITEKNILAQGGVATRLGTAASSLYNAARGRYISAANLYQGALYPQVEEATAIADDGGARVLDLDFPWVQDEATAERLARYAIRRTRFPRMFTITMAWEGYLYVPFSVWNLNIPETDDTNLLVRVLDKQMSASGVTVLTFQEEDASIYDDTIALGTPPVQATGPATVNPLSIYTPRYIDGTIIDTLRPAAIDADKTSINTAADTALVNAVAAATVQSNAQTGKDLTTSNGVVLNRTSIDTILFTAHEDFDMDEGSNTRKLVNSLLTFNARDGESFTFSPTFSSIPVVIFGSMGVVYDPNLDQGSKQFFTVREPQTLSSSGFTAKLRLEERSTGTIVNKNLTTNTPSSGLQRDSGNKGVNDSGTTSTVADKYTLSYTITLTGVGGSEPLSVQGRVNFYENSGGSFVSRASDNYLSNNGSTPKVITDSLQMTKNGIDSADNFRIKLTKTGGTGTVAITGTAPNTFYQTFDASGTSDVTSTPSGTPDIPGMVIFNKDGGTVT